MENLILILHTLFLMLPDSYSSHDNHLLDSLRIWKKRKYHQMIPKRRINSLLNIRGFVVCCSIVSYSALTISIVSLMWISTGPCIWFILLSIFIWYTVPFIAGRWTFIWIVCIAPCIVTITVAANRTIRCQTLQIIPTARVKYETK